MQKSIPLSWLKTIEKLRAALYLNLPLVAIEMPTRSFLLSQQLLVLPILFSFGSSQRHKDQILESGLILQFPYPCRPHSDEYCPIQQVNMTCENQKDFGYPSGVIEKVRLHPISK
jgi:hypothetical protein